MPLILRADPPKKIILDYNSSEKVLKIDIVHPVKDVEKHYIDMVVIYVSGKEVKRFEFKKQQNPKEDKIEFNSDKFVPGAEVEVRASCNLFGTKKEKIKLS